MANKEIFFQHVAISVTNLEEAIKFYKNVFSAKEPNTPKYNTDDDKKLIRERRKDLFGDKMKELKIANLLMDCGVGIELFEFKIPKAKVRKNNFEYWKTGFFHVAFGVKNIGKTIRKIKDNGGQIRSKIWEVFPSSEYKAAYCEDPFGNIFEIITCSFNEMVNRK